MLLLNVLQLAGAPGGSNACAETLCAQQQRPASVSLSVACWLEIAERFALCMHLLRFDTVLSFPHYRALKLCQIACEKLFKASGGGVKCSANKIEQLSCDTYEGGASYLGWPLVSDRCACPMLSCPIPRRWGTIAARGQIWGDMDVCKRLKSHKDASEPNGESAHTFISGCRGLSSSPARFKICLLIRNTANCSLAARACQWRGGADVRNA